MLKRSSFCRIVHGSDQGGATSKNSREAREARHDEIESDLVGTAAVGGPDPPCFTRASRQALDAVILKRDAWRRERHAHRARGDRRSRPLFERPCAPAVEHRRRGRSWSATRRAGTVSEITQAHEGARCSKVAGNVVALLRAAVQARNRLCRDGSGLRGYRSRAGGAAVCSDEERGVR
jgi:hypothetical protein